MKSGKLKFFLLFSLAIIYLLFDIYFPQANLQVDFLAIGQGNAVLMQTPSGQTILFDGGPDNTLLTELGEVLPWWKRRIDYVLISHYHADHFAGLLELAEHYRLGEVIVTGHQPSNDLLFQLWQNKIAEYNIKVTVAYPGEKWELGNNLSWQVLSADAGQQDYNDNSLVVRVSYGQMDWLFPGDLTALKEKEVLASGFTLDSEVLNVGHHGSKYSSSPDWLQAISPELCLIQSEEGNSFGHPHQELLQRLEEVNCRVERNDQQGRITVFSDGQDWWIKAR